MWILRLGGDRRKKKVKRIQFSLAYEQALLELLKIVRCLTSPKGVSFNGNTIV